MLAKLFIKDYKNTEDTMVRNAYGVLASVVGVVANVLLSALKIALGIIFSSIAVLADGINNLSDAGSSVITAIGFKISSMPADKKHPYGHARVEYVASMVVSFIILFLGLELGISSIEKLVRGEETSASIIVMILLGVSILVKLAMFVYFRSIARKINSDAIKANSMDSLYDSIATFAVLISMLIMYFCKVNIDGYMGIVVALIILFSGAKLFKETVSKLIGERPPKEFVEHIENLIKSHDGVLGVHDLEVHNYGENIYHLSVHVEIDSSRTMLASHAIVDHIERDLKEEGIDAVIHIDPIIVGDTRMDDIKKNVDKLVSDIAVGVSFHDFRVAFYEHSMKIIFDVVLPSNTKLNDQEVIALLDNKLRELYPTATTIIDIDRNYVG